MKAIVTLSALALVTLAVVGPSPAAAAACHPVGGEHFICGTMNSEDLVPVPGTKWIVASGFAGGGAKVGHLYLINSRTKSFIPLLPSSTVRVHFDKATYGKSCPGAPNLDKLSTHGLNLRAGSNGDDTLYVVNHVVNHGGRESIEIFTFDATAAKPTLTWVGCAVMPPHTWPNAVAPMPGGGFVVTDMFDPKDPKAPAKMNAGQTTGAVYAWRSQSGFKLVPGSRFSGDNGIEVSRDGKWLFVAAWGNKSVVRLSLDAGPIKRKVIKVGYLADNLRWQPDGTLTITGQDVSAGKVFGCFQSKNVRCTQPWRVDRWDTADMKITPLFRQPGNADFGDATTALQVGKDWFFGTFRGDRVAYRPMQ